MSFLAAPAGDAGPRTGTAIVDLGAIVVALAVAEGLLEQFARDHATGHSPLAWSGFALAALGGTALWLRRVPRAGLLCALAGLGAVYLERFPQAANHHFLLWVVLAAVALFDLRRPEESARASGAVRWLTAAVFFHTGFQKLWYGTYVKGQYFAASFHRQERFADFFGWLVPAAEMDRIAALGPPVADAGPFRVEWVPFWFVTNAVVAAEILLPIGLLWPKTRRIAWPLSLALIVGIEIGARELVFGGLFVALLFAFRAGNPFARARWAFLAFAAALVAARLAFPEWSFA